MWAQIFHKGTAVVRETEEEKYQLGPVLVFKCLCPFPESEAKWTEPTAKVSI